MHETPEAPKPNGSPQGEPREFVSPDVLKLLEHEAREGRERRAERRRDEVVWRRLQRADAALRVEDYFRSGPLRPSLKDMMSTIDLPAGAVDKEFLRACGVVAERFRRQSEDTGVVLEKLKESAKQRGFVPDGANLGQELYKDMTRQFTPGRPDALHLRRVHGFLFLSVDDEDAYNNLYNERTPAERSGGRFHRSQMVNIANRSVPLVTRRGALAGRAEDDAVMIHEIQHWINEGLVGLGDMETPRSSLLRLKQKERKEILDREERRRPIKDEILAYLREGRIENVKSILDGKLYKHLFEGNPAEDPKNRGFVAEVSSALATCVPLFKKYPRLKERMTYALIDVPLESLRMHIDAILDFVGRMERLLGDQLTISYFDISHVQWVPREYTSAKDQLATSQEALRGLRVDIESVLRGTTDTEDKKKLRATVSAFHNEAVTANDALAALQPKSAFVPFVSKIEGGEAYTSSEYNRENEFVLDLLDRVDAFPKDLLQTLCERIGVGMHPQAEEKTIAADLITLVTRHVVEKEHLDYPNVSLFVSDLGVQIAIGYSRQTARGLTHLYTLVNVPRKRPVAMNITRYCRPPGNSELAYGEEFLDESLIANADEYIPGVLPKKYSDIYRALQRSGEEREHLRDVMRTVQRSSDRDTVGQRRFSLHIKQLQRAYQEYEQLREKLIVDGAHIPQIYEWDIPGLYYPKEIVPVVKQSLEKLSTVLFDAARGIEQDIVDGWIDEGEHDEDDWSRHAAVQEILFASVGTSFGSGKIQKIAMREMHFEKNEIRIVVECSIQEKHGSWLDGRSTIILHRRRPVAKSSVLR